MIYNSDRFAGFGGITVIINQIPLHRLADSITAPGFNSEGLKRVRVERWSVGGDPQPRGVEPREVAAHYAAVTAAKFGGGMSVMCKSLEPGEVYSSIRSARHSNGACVFPTSNPYGIALYSVQTEKAAYALYIDADGCPEMIPAHEDVTAQAKRAAGYADEKARPADADKAAGMYWDCVEQALKDPAVMGAIFNVSDISPIETARTAFYERPYVKKAIADIEGMK